MTSAYSQSLPSQCKAYKPKSLNKTIVYLSDASALAKNNYGQSSSTGKYWDVYSDRNNNTVYKSASKSSGSAGKLSFNQKVRIAEVSNGFALVYKENKPGAVTYPQISADTKCYGWVPMENLLLWESCPADKYGIYRKALIVRNIEEGSDKMTGMISDSPETFDNAVSIGNSIDFHYIMKTAKGPNGKELYLIAAYNKMGGINERVLEGWISKNTFTPWNQRSCLEPNWDKDVVSYFSQNGKKAWLYETNRWKEGEKIVAWPYGKANKERQESTKYRMAKNAMRFPILDKDHPGDEDYFKVTAFGSQNGDLAEQSIQDDAQKSAIEKVLNKVSVINIIVVIDGTKSMNKYFTAMSNAVSEATAYLKDESGKTQVRVGAVIYRNQADGANEIEIQKVGSPDRVKSFLNSIGNNGYGANSKGTTWHESMYLGLKTALDYNTMGYDPKNTNVVFLIGDCGNLRNDTRVLPKDILAMANKVDAMFFSFQVSSEDKDAWGDYNDQLFDIFDGHMKRLYKSEDNFYWKPVAAGNKVHAFSNEYKVYTSEMYYPQLHQTLNEAMLNKHIQESYKSALNVYQHQVAVIEGSARRTKTFGSDGNVTKGEKINQDFLKRKMGADYDENDNSLYAFTGYAQKDDGEGRDYWNAIVYMSSEELLELIKKLEPLKKASRVNTYTTQDRANYVSAVVQIVKSMTGMDTDEIESKSTTEITQIIGGLNASTPMLKGKQTQKVYTLSDIKNAQACPDEEFKNILHVMANKIDNLSRLPQDSSFKYKFKQNAITSYWIPLEMIP